ncbi:MAG: hypothetical protein J5662_01580 [Clostridia bacterium]|nr:hypothetical protein [Clostridia bacterium]
MKKDNITVISKPRENECGGTYATLDNDAPKKIISNDITLFSVTSKLNMFNAGEEDGERLRFVSAFAAKTERGSFLYLETLSCYDDNRNSYLAFVKSDIFPLLDAIARQYNFAKQNGFHSTTHGLPENFGGDVKIRYESGEEINFSDNQSPVIPVDAGVKIASVFGEYAKAEPVPLPGTPDIEAIRFFEERDDGFTKAELKIRPDGTAVNYKSSKYGDGKIFESEKEVDKDTVAQILKTVLDCGMLAWRYLPENEYAAGNLKTLTFVFKDKIEITADNRRSLPLRISNGFFDIELEIATKH